MRSFFVGCFFFLAVQPAAAQDTVRVMTYNLLRYYPSDQSRDQYYRTVIRAVNPDILVVQEIDTASAVLNFLTNVLNAGGSNDYTAGVFIDGYDSDNAIFYKPAVFAFVENKPIATRLRDISQFTLNHSASGRPFVILSAHLKAGSNPANPPTYPEADSTRRSQETDSLRKASNALPAGTDFIVVGDFNIYGSFESAYQKLTAVNVGNEGHVIDPVTMTGTWNTPAYAPFHTQSPRTRSFGYGATGGLDDRFDMILMSKSASESGGIAFVPNSCRAFGNDGQHYNDSINSRPNAAVSDSVADALHAASDHLPVVSEFVFDPAVRVERNESSEEGFLLINYPNPFNPATVISYQIPAHGTAKAGTALGFVRLSIFDMLGREVAVLVNEEKMAGKYTVVWDASDKPTGVYFCRMTAGPYIETRRVLLMK